MLKNRLAVKTLQNLYVGFLLSSGVVTLLAFQNCQQAYKLDVKDQASAAPAANAPLGDPPPGVANQGNAKLSLSPISSTVTVLQGDKLSSTHSLKVIKSGAGQAFLRRFNGQSIDIEAVTSALKTINLDLSGLDTSKVGTFQKEFLFQSGDSDILKYTLNVTVQAKKTNVGNNDNRAMEVVSCGDSAGTTVITASNLKSLCKDGATVFPANAPNLTGAVFPKVATWQCKKTINGQDYFSGPCTATVQPQSTAQCNSLYSGFINQLPPTNSDLCAAGSDFVVPTGATSISGDGSDANPWKWSCSKGSTTVACSAKKALPVQATDCVSVPSQVNLEYEVGQSKPFTVNFSMLKDASGKLKCPAGVSVLRLNVSNSSVAGIQNAPLLKNSGVAVGFVHENLCYKDANNKYCKTDFAENFDAVGSQKVGEYDWFTMNYSISPAKDANGNNVDTGVQSQLVRVVVHVKANAPNESNLTNGTVLGYTDCSPQETSNDLGNRAEGVIKAYRSFSQVAGSWSNCQIQECAEGYYYDHPTNPPLAPPSCKKVKDTCDIPKGVTYEWYGNLFRDDAGLDGKMCHATTTQDVSLTMDDGSIHLSDPLDTTQPLKYDLSGTYDLVCKSKNVEVIKGFEYSAQGRITNTIKYTLKFPELVRDRGISGASTETCKIRFATCDLDEALPLSSAKQYLSINDDPIGFVLGNIPLPNIMLDQHSYISGTSLHGMGELMTSYRKFYLNKIDYSSDPKTVDSYNNIQFSLEYKCDGKTGKKIPKKLTYWANHPPIRSLSNSACQGNISNRNLLEHSGKAEFATNPCGG